MVSTNPAFNGFSDLYFVGEALASILAHQYCVVALSLICRG
ncbi:MAG: hypothetical protein RLZZ541_453 [Pseudomonadota bacterium]|jgi:hypothetical protein